MNANLYPLAAAKLLCGIILHSSDEDHAISQCRAFFEGDDYLRNYSVYTEMLVGMLGPDEWDKSLRKLRLLQGIYSVYGMSISAADAEKIYNFVYAYFDDGIEAGAITFDKSDVLEFLILVRMALKLDHVHID